MGLNRNQKRAAARANHGMSLGQFRRARAENERLKQEALTITPEEARRRLAQWAAQPGRTQAEIDALNLTPADMRERSDGKA